MSIRKKVQSVSFIVFNLHVPSSLSPIYQGKGKFLLCPGLNCYSCPLATTACPIGSLQTLLASVKASISQGRMLLGLYVIGYLSAIGSVAGRMVCGWICPFGLIQEIIHKIPTKKFQKIPEPLKYFKYLVLTLLVFAFPVVLTDKMGYGLPWFCRIACPAGTLEAGIPHILTNPQLRSGIGHIFFGKLGIMMIFLVWSVFTSRPFCRTTCPLGAFYSLFNRISAFRLVHIKENCVRCEECYRKCPMGVKFFESPNDLNCIRCLRCMKDACKYGAITYEVVGIKDSSRYMSSR